MHKQRSKFVADVHGKSIRALECCHGSYKLCSVPSCHKKLSSPGRTSMSKILTESGFRCPWKSRGWKWGTTYGNNVTEEGWPCDTDPKLIYMILRKAIYTHPASWWYDMQIMVIYKCNIISQTKYILNCVYLYVDIYLAYKLYRIL